MSDFELDSVEEEKKQYIVVRIGSEQYGIDISYIDNRHLTTMPVSSTSAARSFPS